MSPPCPACRQVFARFNLKKDQKLSADEIFEMLVALRMPHEPREIIRFLLSADKDGDQLVTLKDFRIYVHSFAVGDGEPEDADVEPMLGPQRELTPLMPSPQRSLSPSSAREETEEELARLRQELRGAMERVRAEIAREEEQRAVDYETMVAEMKENCGGEAERNPSFMPTEHKWRWDFQRGALPRLVRLMPRDLKFSPVAEPSPKLEGKFFLQLAANGALDVGTSDLHTELVGAEAVAWARDVSHPRVNQWSATTVLRLSARPLTTAPFSLLTLLRDPTDESRGPTTGSLVLHLEGWLALSTGTPPPPPVSAADAAKAGDVLVVMAPLLSTMASHQVPFFFDKARASAGEAAPPWPLEWQDGLRCFPKKKKIVLEKAQWSVVTISVDLPRDVSVFLNGERVLQLTRASLPAASPEAAAALGAALEVDGPFSLDSAAGFRLFAHGGAEGLLKDVRALTLAPQPLSTCQVWTEHTSYGAWRCQGAACHQSFCDETDFNPRGLRNGPDAERCAFCGKARLRSQEEPKQNPDTTQHPGLWTVTASNFEEVVLRSEENVFLVYTANWCPPRSCPSSRSCRESRLFSLLTTPAHPHQVPAVPRDEARLVQAGAAA